MQHFVSETCKGEICGMCFRGISKKVPATHKIGEELAGDFPILVLHNLTQYVCCKHFREVLGEAVHVYRSCPEEE